MRGSSSAWISHYGWSLTSGNICHRTAARVMCRAAAVQPLDAAAQNARGLACEARGALDAAVAAFSTAADILSSSPDAPGELQRILKHADR